MTGKVGVAPSTTTITLPNGQTIALADWIDDRLFGCVQLVTATTGQVEAYTTGRSQAIPGGARNQQRCDTNLQKSGENGLPKDYEMLLYGIAIGFVRAMRPVAGVYTLIDAAGTLSDPPNLRTVFNVNRVTAFRFEYNSKAYSEGVISDYPAGTGYSVFSVVNAFELAQNGIPSPRDRVAMVLPIHMREGITYKGIFDIQVAFAIAQAASDGGVAMNAVDVKVTLNGLVKRIVV
jgi:hypothetical protein